MPTTTNHWYVLHVILPLVLLVLCTSRIECIVTPTNATTTTTVKAVDSKTSAGAAKPMFSDHQGRLIGSSSSVQNITMPMDKNSTSLVMTALSSSSSSSNGISGNSSPSNQGNQKPNYPATRENSKSFVDIVKDYERYKLTKNGGGDGGRISATEPTMIYQGSLRAIKERQPLLSPSTLQGYNHNYINEPFEYSTADQDEFDPWSEPDLDDGSPAAYGLPGVKSYGSFEANDGRLYEPGLDYGPAYDFELMPQGSQLKSYEPPHVTYDNNKYSPISAESMDSAGFLNYHQLVANMAHSQDDLPILIESYVVNYPPLAKEPVAHSLSAFTYGNHHHHHHRHQMPHLHLQQPQYPPTRPGAQLPGLGYRAAASAQSERVFISPYLYSRPCKYDCFASPLQDMKYGLLNFLEGAHNHGRR